MAIHTSGAAALSVVDSCVHVRASILRPRTPNVYALLLAEARGNRGEYLKTGPLLARDRRRVRLHRRRRLQ